MEQSAKRQRIEDSLERHIRPYFAPKHQRLAVYFYVALECDTPILEALLFTTFALTRYKSDEHWETLLIRIGNLFAEKALIYYPTESSEHRQYRNLETGQWVSIRLTYNPLATTWKSEDLRVLKFNGLDRDEDGFHLMANKETREISMLTRHTDNYIQRVKWNCLQSVVDEQIEFLILPPKQTT
jgi:hypothetical protein